MRSVILAVLTALPLMVCSQNFQLHYDFRHQIDPKAQPVSYPSFSFEYFKNLDTIGTGSFLMKIQADLKGRHQNAGQIFTQLTHSIKFWKPKVYLSVNYTGGLGVTPTGYGFYLTNTFAAGVAYPFQWKGAWLSASLLFRYSSFDRPSYDPQVIAYFGKGFASYKIFVAGSFVFWTENRNQGNEITQDLSGKKLAFFGDPQIWFRITKGFSIGSRINVYYHLLTDEDRLQVYPTLGTKFQF